MTQKIPQPEDWRDILGRLEKKIDFLILQVDRLNHTINPPIWKKVLKWVWRNWLTIAMLLVVGFIAWNAWEAFQTLTEKIAEIQAIPSRALGEIQSLPIRATETLWDAVERVRFW